jgi:hypothetical protein
VVWADDPSGEGNNYYTCPLKFVTNEICDWYREYQYVKEFGTHIEYHEQSNRYIEAWEVYKNYRDKFDAEEAEFRMIKAREKSRV